MGPLVSGYRRLALMLIFGFLLQAAASATTYYIDYAAGNDSNNGTSKTTPWQRIPGMPGCSGTCASTRPSAGDRYILKGGVTWTNANFPVLWTWSGTSGNSIYIGVDTTWYTGGSWTRPIFNAQGSVISTHNNFVRMTGGAGSYTTWDNIEFTGYAWTGGGYGEIAFFCTGACSGSVTNITITNNYFHNWSHTTASSDGLYILMGSTNSPYMSGSLIDSNVFDNTDGDHVSGAMMYGWSGTITNNVIHNVSNGILPMGSGGVVAYNSIGPVVTSFDSSVHENAIETLGGTNPTWYIHDNIIHDGAVGEAMMIGNTGETDYVWNNVIWNWSGNAPHFAQNNGQTITRLSFWNNTIVPVAGGNCFIEVFSPTIGQLDIQNNHCITTGTLNSTITGVTTLNVDHNVLQTPSAAATQGYSTGQTYVYTPTSSSGSTVNAGVNLSSHATGSVSGLQSDTLYACDVDSTNHVACPARTANSRPNGTGAWDVGSYLFGGTASQPAAPTNLAASVQ